MDGTTRAPALRAGRLEVDLGAGGAAEFDVARHRFDRIRVDLDDGLDTLVSPARPPASASTSGPPATASG